MLSPFCAAIQHHIGFLLSSYGLLAPATLVVLLYLYHTSEGKFHTRRSPKVPGCCRLGIQGRSNLDDQGDSKEVTSGEARVSALFVYPIKSCQGVELHGSEVSSLGLQYDRLFSFAQLVPAKPETLPGAECAPAVSTNITREWRFVTQREIPRLAMLKTELWIPRVRGGDEPCFDHHARVDPDKWSANGGCVIIHFPVENASALFRRTETITLRIPLRPTMCRVRDKGYSREPLSIWLDNPSSINMTSEIEPVALGKLQNFLGISSPLGLFRIDEDNLRSISRSLPKEDPYSSRGFSVGFADAFPVHLLSVPSIRAVENELPGTSLNGQLDARRFRANIYVSGIPAYSEDRWMRIGFGTAVDGENRTRQTGEYHIACRTARCNLTNVHPESGVRDRREPHATLKKIRQVDEGAKPHPCLGLSMMPLFSRGRIQVGDVIEVTKTGEHYYEKMFS